MIFGFKIRKARQITATRRAVIYARDDFRCVYCGRDVIVTTDPEIVSRFKTRPIASIDHIIPRCEGGTNEEDNLVTACRRCNLERGTMDAFEYLAIRFYLTPTQSMKPGTRLRDFVTRD